MAIFRKSDYSMRTEIVQPILIVASMYLLILKHLIYIKKSDYDNGDNCCYNCFSSRTCC